ncbi:hypothetical protein H4R33_007057 [Dimargaris cristalligena]|nr:hypothetical protein H4R33_007057 [Dimargaris cristalligena]
MPPQRVHILALVVLGLSLSAYDRVSATEDNQPETRRRDRMKANIKSLWYRTGGASTPGAATTLGHEQYTGEPGDAKQFGSDETSTNLPSMAMGQGLNGAVDYEARPSALRPSSIRTNSEERLRVESTH